ncbi:MAG: class I SAM-dependent rRNA methyltransferase [Flammeovirgaceae bacterium]|nr:class I SAM-dependent rRNA methyltransferase [Flammeovirgaceae bacterium]
MIQLAGKIILKKGKENSVQRFHPWIFSGAIQQMEGAVTDGCWVEVQDHQKKTIAFGHYQNGSIAVRILSFSKNNIDNSFWEQSIRKAYQLRSQSFIYNHLTNCYRLIHGEGDGLPGLIVDLYNGIAIVQAHSTGMHNDRAQIAAALKQVFGEEIKAIYYKSQGTLPGKLRDDVKDEYLLGMSAVPHVITENGVKFYVDWEGGQKTGFFLDQRDNRKLLGQFSAGKKVLNTFCYTGGFSLYALTSGAQLVHSVDASVKAIALTEKNITLNGFDPAIHTCFAVDTFDFLKGRENQYDLIILDPPAFAKHRDAKHQAMKGYQRLNAEAMKVIKSGGVLFTFSCSQVVDRQMFYDTVVSAAILAKREIKVLHHLSQPADHPVSIFHPEGEYLKGLVLFVV